MSDRNVGGKPSENWTPQVVELMTVLWLRGDSCSQIAVALNRRFGIRVTRNAVIGKVTRLKLPGRLVATRAVTGKAMADRVRAARVKTALKLPPKPMQRGPKRPPTEGLMTHAEHRDFQHCAMFCKGEDGPNGKVCGKPCAPGTTYCPSCLALAYQPAPKPKAARAA